MQQVILDAAREYQFGQRAMATERNAYLATSCSFAMRRLSITRGQPWTEDAFKSSWSNTPQMKSLREKGWYSWLRKSVIAFLLEAGAAYA